LKTAGQRVVNATNDLETDKLTLDRVTGIPLAQKWSPTREYGYTALANPLEEAQRVEETRADVASAKQEVLAGELCLAAAVEVRRTGEVRGIDGRGSASSAFLRSEPIPCPVRNQPSREPSKRILYLPKSRYWSIVNRSSKV
jgi:hypothetical protein